MAASAAAVAATATSASTPKGQAHLEVYAELTQSGIAAITQMQNGQLIIGYHPFYLTPTSVQVATLNADRRSSTPYPPAGSGLLQSCRNPDGSFLPAQNGRYDFCLDWVLGFHADANGILWILDGAKSTEKATGAGTVRPAALHAKYVGWDTKTNKLFKVIDLDSVTIAASQHNDFAIDLKHGAQGTLIAADEAVGDAEQRSARRHRHCDGHEPPRAARRLACDCEPRSDPMGGAGGTACGGMGLRGRRRRHHAGQESGVALLRAAQRLRDVPGAHDRSAGHDASAMRSCPRGSSSTPTSPTTAD